MKKTAGRKEAGEVKSLKKVLLISVLIIVGTIDILIYWNSHIYYKAKGIEDNEKKIEILDKAVRYYPVNDNVFYEIGKAYFALAIENLDDKDKNVDYFQDSIESFKHSIRINPASQFCHFNLAQSLIYLNTLSPSLDLGPYEEYKKAVFLVGENSQIFFEAGKIFLSRWDELSERDRNFAKGVLRKIMEGKDKKRQQTIMQIWEMNVKDYSIMEEILPEDSRIYRMYAKFLGEKSLILEKRQKYLAEAELIEFERAKSEYLSGENELFYFEMKEAVKHFNLCLNILKRIKFYQNLSSEGNLIDLSEFNDLKRSTLLKIVECRLEEGASLKEVENSLYEYLDMQEKVSEVSALESFLLDRGFMSKKLGDSFDDLEILSLQLLLSFKQNRYRDIMRIGRLFQQSFVVVPEGKKADYVRILQIVGDAYQKVDDIYEAGEFYQKALEIEQDNLGTLLKMRNNYERLNDNKKIKEVGRRIDKVLSLQKIDIKNYPIKKGKKFYRTLILDGRKIIMDISFDDEWKIVDPLITVFFNGRVVWEGYLKEKTISIPMDTKVGKNSLEIAAVNRGVSVRMIGWNPSISRQ